MSIVSLWKMVDLLDIVENIETLPLQIAMITHKQILTEGSSATDDPIIDGLRGRVLHREKF